MLWQDIVLTSGSVIFAAALLPSVVSKDKPAVSTSLMTRTVLFIFAYVYITLALWFSAVAVSITGALWYILAFQKLRQNK